MFNFFNKNQNNDAPKPRQPDWISVLTEAQQRLFLFLDKLEDKMQELTEMAIPELNAIKLEDEREFGTMLNGLQGQLDSVRDKALHTYEEKIENLYQEINDQIEIFDPFYNHLRQFRTDCSDRFYKKFEEKYHAFSDQLKQTMFTDYEVVYQQILDEHEQIKNQFKCQQCGDTIPLTKIYFTAVHLTCPSCEIKNTFQPSTLAQGLEQIGRSLAEQRMQYLLDNYYQAQADERTLYHQAHELKLKKSPFNNEADNEVIQQQINQLEQQRKETEKSIPQLYQQYQRAMFDEWKKLVPDLAEHNEKFYQSLNSKPQ